MEPRYMDLLRALEALGGRAINAHLMRRMDVTPEVYLELKAEALADKVIKLARGRGGVVILVGSNETE